VQWEFHDSLSAHPHRSITRALGECSEAEARFLSICAGLDKFIRSLPSIRPPILPVADLSSSTPRPLSPPRSRHGFSCIADPVLAEVHIIAASAILLLRSTRPHDAAHHGQSINAAIYIADVVNGLDAACIRFLCGSIIAVGRNFKCPGYDVYAQASSYCRLDSIFRPTFLSKKSEGLSLWGRRRMQSPDCSRI
jgi:hypothetical protein